MTTHRVAVVQAYIPTDLCDGIASATRLTAEASSQGARLVVFPETWLPGYPAWLDVCRDAALWNHPPVKATFARLAENSVVVHGSSGHALSRIAADHDVTLVIGVSERIESGPGRGTLYNTLLTFGPDGALLNHHRKLMPTYTERLVWGMGDAAGIRVAETPVGRVGGLVCWEHWMPAARQALHECGEDIHIAAWPTVIEMHQIASRHYAFEGRCFVLAVGSLMTADALPLELDAHIDRVKHPSQKVMRGGSAIIGPDGMYLAGPVFDGPCIIYADLDLKRLREESMTLDVTGHYHRPDCFRLVTSRGARLAGDGDLTWATPPQTAEIRSPTSCADL